jgi:hypothetical protein
LFFSFENYDYKPKEGISIKNLQNILVCGVDERIMAIIEITTIFKQPINSKFRTKIMCSLFFVIIENIRISSKLRHGLKYKTCECNMCKMWGYVTDLQIVFM